jgi:hypothetical protein
MEIIGKISLKTVGGNPALAAVLKSKVPMCRIWGKASNIKTAVGQNGDPVFGLAGSFMALNYQDQKEFQSGVCYLPGGIQELIQEPLEALLNSGERGGAVEFALDVFAIPATNKAGYSFAAETLTEISADDPMVKMKKALEAKALPTFPKIPTPEEIAAIQAKAKAEADAAEAKAKAEAEAEAAKAKT